jgi:hypothetical protein
MQYLSDLSQVLHWLAHSQSLLHPFDWQVASENCLHVHSSQHTYITLQCNVVIILFIARLQVLYKICLHVHSSRRLLWKAGAVQALLQLVSQDKDAVGFHRDRAAVALATLAEAAEVKAWLGVRMPAMMRLFVSNCMFW